MKLRNRPPSRLWVALAEGPFEVPIAAYLGFVGLLGLFSGGGVRPATIDEALPLWLVMAWTVGIALGGLLTALGKVVIHNRLESAGLILLGYGASFYAATLVVVAFPVSTVSAAAFLAIAIGCGIRLRVLSRARRAVEIAGGIIENGDH